MAEYTEGYYHEWQTNLPSGDPKDAWQQVGVIQWSHLRGSRKQELVSLSGGAFTALTVPAGALGVTIVLPVTGGAAVTLKGASGDTGIKVTGVYNKPIVLPIRPDATIGLLKEDSGVLDGVKVFWW